MIRIAKIKRLADTMQTEAYIPDTTYECSIINEKYVSFINSNNNLSTLLLNSIHPEVWEIYSIFPLEIGGDYYE
jgi:hypothetical protein